MKTHLTRSTLTSCAAALAFGLAALPAVRAETHSLKVAPQNARAQVAEKLTGQKIIASNGESLGTIKDFAIASPDGSPVYAVVSTGGMLGMGDTLRLVPTNALTAQVARGSDGFTVALDAAGWNQLAPIDRDGFERGYLRLTPDQHAALNTPFRDHEGFNATRLDNDAQLIRASDLRNQEILAGTEEVGEIEGVVIDLNASRASVLLETEDDFAGREHLVLVPMSKLTFTASKNDRIVTSLTRDDFARLDASAPVARTDATAYRNDAVVARTDASVDNPPQPRQPAVIAGENLPPTGRTELQRQSPEELLKVGANSVRDVLKAQPRFQNADIDVKADYGKIVLSGHAVSEDQREQIVDVAEGVTGFDILNNIVVKPERR